MIDLQCYIHLPGVRGPEKKISVDYQILDDNIAAGAVAQGGKREIWGTNRRKGNVEMLFHCFELKR